MDTTFRVLYLCRIRVIPAVSYYNFSKMGRVFVPVPVSRSVLPSLSVNLATTIILVDLLFANLADIALQELIQ